MKHALLSFCFLTFTLLGIAQTGNLNFSTTSAKKTEAVDLSDPFLDVKVPITITNTGKDTAKIIWRRMTLNGPSKWTTRVCDNNLCYDEIVSSNLDPKLRINQPFKIVPGAKADLIMYFLPYGNAGTGKISVQIALAAKPDSVLTTLSYEANIRSISTSTRDLQPESIQLFPNPSTDYFQLNRIDNIDHLVLYNVLGRKIREYDADNGARYRLNGLPDGIYLLALVNDRKGVVRTLRIQKRSTRP